MHLLCPHCQNPIELIRLNTREEIQCPSCGSSFKVEGEATTGSYPVQGHKIGRFEILGNVGSGAHGTVYKARDPELDRIVAVKVPRTGNLEGVQELSRFIREARSVAQLRHPTIVPVHEVGEWQPEGSAAKLCYLVSDFVDGITLADLLSARRPSFRESAELIANLAEALHYAHQMGVVHRDVKPSNVMLETAQSPSLTRGNGSPGLIQSSASHGQLTPRLMDFGLAKRDAGEITMTVDGQVLGTPAYMSPEQAKGEAHEVDGRSDVYSLGVILYQLLTGELPFRGTTRMLLHQVLHDEPRTPRSLNDKIPLDLETICLKAMAKEPGRRYQDARGLADDLHRWLKGEPIQARPTGSMERAWRWGRRNPVVTSLLAATASTLLLGTSVASWFAFWAEANARLARGRLETAVVEKQQKEEARKLAEARRKIAESRLAENYLARGLHLCEQGEVAQGMLWLGRSLENVPPDDADLERVIRANLGAWRGRLSPVNLRARLLHQGGVRAVAFSPDGCVVATASLDGTARLWQVATGKPICKPMQHKGPVQELYYSPNGRALVTVRSGFLFGGPEEETLLWDARTGDLIKSLGILERGVVFSPDGNTLLAGGRLWSAATGDHVAQAIQHAECFSADGKAVLTRAEDRIVRLVEVATGQPLGPALDLSTHQFAAFGPDGRTVVTTSEKAARLWNIATGMPIEPPLEHSDPVRSAVFSSDGKSVITWTIDTVQVWDAATAKAVCPPLRNEDSIDRVGLSPDGRTVLVVNHASEGDYQARLWDVTKGQSIGEPLEHGRDIWTYAFSPDSRMLLTGSLDGTVGLWDTTTGKALGRPLRHGGMVWGIAFSRDGKTALTGCGSFSASGGGEGRLWAVGADSPIASSIEHEGAVENAEFSPDGKMILTTSEKSVQVWDAMTLKPIGSPMREGELIKAARLSPDGKKVVTLCLDKTARVWETTTETPVGTPLVHADPLFCAVFSPEHPTILIACGDIEQGRGEARLWDVITGKVLTPPMQHQGPIIALGFSPDGKTVGTGSMDGTARLWDASTGKPLSPALRHQGWVTALAFSPDGRRLAAGGGDPTRNGGEARLWDVTTGEPFGLPLQHQGLVSCLAFSPDGSHLLTGSWDKTGQVWDTKAGKPIGPPLPHLGRVECLAFSPDGRTVLTGSADQTVRLWDMSTGKPVGAPFQHDAPVRVATFSSNGRSILTASGSTVRLLAVPLPVQGEVKRIDHWIRVTTCLELDSHSRIQELDNQSWQQLREQLEELGGPP